MPDKKMCVVHGCKKEAVTQCFLYCEGDYYGGDFCQQHAAEQESDATYVPDLEELLNLIEQNADAIYIRETVAGKRGNYALSNLPADLALYHAFRFIRQRMIPKFQEED
jgi:hypothetical protein